MMTGCMPRGSASAAFLAPFLFAFQPPLLWRGTYLEIAIAFVSALVGISALSAAVAATCSDP